MVFGYVRRRIHAGPTPLAAAGTGKTGYAPVCVNEWAPWTCGKPRVKWGACPNQACREVSDEAIDGHLRGRHTINVYPMLSDDTCRFLAADFDKANWQRDAGAFLEACRSKDVPAALERSRSGNGGQVWIFFAEPVPAALARRLSAHLVTATMERNPDIGFASYDRFFPSQDTVLTSGFGNLIALPLHGGNSVFLDDSFEPHADQWAFLSSLRRLSLAEATAIVEEVGAGSARLSGCVCRSTKRTTNPGARRRRGGGRCPRLPDRCRSGSTRFWATRSTSRPPVCR